jgi:iron complex transport system substrate-binding protein
MRLALTLLTLLLLLTALMPLAAQDNSALPITLTDATGTEVTIQRLDRIVSASGDVTEIIYALGFYDHLVGIDATSTYPEYALDEIEKIGFSRALTLEPIVAQNPDVVFCTQICTPLEVLQQLRDLGIPVVIVPDSENGGMELPFPKFAMVAQALGVPEAGAELAERVQREIDWAQTAVANVEGTPSVLHFYVRGRGLQLAFGAGVPVDGMIHAAKGINAAAEAGVEGYQPLSPEIILTAFPDYLLFAEGSIEASGGIEALLDIQGVAATPAAQNGNIIIMDTQFIQGMSIRTGQALMVLAHAIHPDMTWETEITYPYSYIDASGTEITVNGFEQLVASNEGLLELTRQLGFHSVMADAIPENSLVIAVPSDLWQPLREAGATVIVVEDDYTIAEVAAALNIPGRGEALLAQMGQ